MWSKYIVVENSEGDVSAIIFSAVLYHNKVARSFKDHKILGAGFVKMEIIDGKIMPSGHGRSDSLNISSTPEDTRYIRQALGIFHEDVSHSNKVV